MGQLLIFMENNFTNIPPDSGEDNALEPLETPAVAEHQLDPISEGAAEAEAAAPEDSDEVLEDGDEPPEGVRHFYCDQDADMLDSLVSFLRKYLVCDEHQLAILALWIVHARTFHHDIRTAAHLYVHSPEPESGKTRCLELLKLLLSTPWFASGPTPKTAIAAMLRERSVKEIEEWEGFLRGPEAILLDDCDQIFSPSERQQLLAMLNLSSRRTSRYMLDDTEYCVCRPMAFAANSRLPRSLASRCIPILLRRKKASETVAQFDPETARTEAAEILEWLTVIADDPRWLLSVIEEGPPQLPAGWTLTAHEQDCAEPLLHIADAIGESWPERARNAIIACSQLADCSPSVQMLADIRASFLMNNNPEHLLTRDLLPMLRSMDHRPWAAWPNNSGSARRLSNLLQPFGISSRKLTGDGIMGYCLDDFCDAWARYLQLPVPVSEPSAEAKFPAISPTTIASAETSATQTTTASGD